MSENSSYKYSVVVPVFNSANTLKELFTRLKSTFDELGLEWEVVFIEDCGKDRSWKVLQEIKEQDPELVTAVRLTKNFGQHNAIFCGFNFLEGDFVITIDDDLQLPPEEIRKLIEKHNETDADVVYGIFKKKEHSKIRNWGSKIVQRFFDYGSERHKDGSSFRLIRADIAKRMAKHGQSFIYIDNILQWYTTDIEVVPVEHLAREEGGSNYSIFKLVILTLKLVVGYTTLPLQLMTYGGLLFSLLSFSTGMYFVYQKWAYGLLLGYTSLIVAIFFATSVILFCLGIIGEYIRRLYMEQNRLPQYVVKKVL